MIVCEECGHQNESSDTFCGSCGAFLEWMGHKIEEPSPEPEPVVNEEDEDPGRPGIVQRVKSAIGLDDGSGPDAGAAVAQHDEPDAAGAEAEAADRGAQAEAAARSAAEAAARAEAEAAATGEALRQAAAERAAAEAAAERAGQDAAKAEREAAEAAAERVRAEEARRDEAARRAAAMVARPTQAPPAPAQGPAAVQPTEERRRPAPRQPKAPPPVVKPGDLICGQCGEGNVPDRNFCRRCGHTLAQAVQAKLPWYRRLFRRQRRVVAAGERPGRAAPGGGGGGRGGRGAVRDAKMAGRKVKSVANKFRRLAALLLIVGVGVAFLGPFRGPANRAYQSVRRVIKPEYEPVRPVDAVASSSAPGRDAKAVIDGIKNSFWAEGAPGAGEKQTLTITFAEPTDLDKVGIIPGASEDPKQFVALPRPRLLHLIFTGARPSAKDITVSDAAKFQSFDVHADDVTSVTIELVSVHASTGGQDCAITELEFFRKK